MKIKKFFRLQTSDFRLRRGFTLIELLIVIGIIAILMAIAIVAINPGRQFAKANNASRFVAVNTILNAVSQNIVDGRGTFDNAACEAPIPDAAAINMAFDSAPENPNTDAIYDICDCLVALYIGAMPVDPTTGSYTSCADYDTGYTIVKDSTTGRVTVSAPGAESENGAAPTISVTR
ncbi:prepilin-type N-terminal cleavage/methylation domain-containing protein [Patescibacteria group bacterium]|nr:prepilin-type N-terminal cleavage/methylation domain-containing protein [Patescibacteria group bacterium]